jgi:hypothetical protein
MTTTSGALSGRSEVHIVVTCAHRKRYPTPPELRIEGIRGRHLGSRFDAWIRRLTMSDVTPVPADDLYGGEHWQIARRLSSHTTDAGHRSQTWVCSAGYGLVPISAALRPYAATFASGHADSVAQTATASQEWWDCHASWVGPAPRQPRSLAALARSAPNAPIVSVLSGTYLRACSHDLLQAARHLQRPELLSIVTPAATAPRDLHEFVLPVSADLQQRLGGSLLSLNVRAGARLLEMASPDLPTRDVLAENLNALGRRLRKKKHMAREPLSDGQVREFIAQRLTDRSTHTGLLRQLRSDGFACEQSRFAALFAETARRQ